MQINDTGCVYICVFVCVKHAYQALTANEVCGRYANKTKAYNMKVNDARFVCLYSSWTGQYKWLAVIKQHNGLWVLVSDLGN